MTVSFMFCALVASYGVRMLVRAVLVNHSGQSPLTLTHLIHEYRRFSMESVLSRGFRGATLVAKY